MDENPVIVSEPIEVQVLKPNWSECGTISYQAIDTQLFNSGAAIVNSGNSMFEYHVSDNPSDYYPMTTSFTFEVLVDGSDVVFQDNINLGVVKCSDESI